MSKLAGKIAVITGGSSGIGLATAKLFVDEGAYVFITGRRPSELDKAKAAIGRNVSTVQGDVSNLEDLDRLFAQVKAEKGALDVLVANAGFVEYAPLAAVTPEHFDKTFAINARGTFFTVQKAAPLIRDGGSIVLVASCVQLKGVPDYQTYGATKAALRFWARSMAAEFKDQGVRVNAISPGATDTPIIDSHFNSVEEADAGKERFRRLTPLGRMGRPEEIARAILFLGSDDSSFTTGAELVADGGVTQI